VDCVTQTHPACEKESTHSERREASARFSKVEPVDPERLSRLDIPLGCNEHRLPLDSTMDDVPLFRRSIRTLHGWRVSRHQVLPYSTLAPWMKTLGAMTGFRQIVRPYTLRYGAGKAFDKNGAS
jgi:hypothetical protein